jgi:4-hydroxy-tetrahydrodipicolinate synthase
LKLRGFNMGNGRQPLAATHELKVDAVSRTLACLLSEEGFADQPVGGCPANRPVDADQVGRIVQGVIAELKQRGLA